jgi:hypothetical protein
MAKPAARRAADPNEVLLQSLDTSNKRAKRGVRAGLRDGETRVTCIFTDEQNTLLHDWAKTTGRTFREVTMAMADLYVREVVSGYVDGGGRLKLGKDQQPPKGYESYYEEDAGEDPFAKYF